MSEIHRNWHIDWLSLRQINLGQWAEVNKGKVISLDENGQQEWTSEKHILEQGSHDSTVRFRVTPRVAEISFNPSRWNKPHNITGVGLADAIAVANRIMKQYTGVEFTPGSISENSEGSIVYLGAVCTRLDVCTNMATGSRGNAEAYRRHAAGIKLPRMKTERKANTVYYIAKGQRVAKIYTKADELRSNKKKLTPEREAAAAWCDKQGLVRIEMKYLNRFLRQNNWRAIQNLSEANIEDQFMKDTEELRKNANEEDLSALSREELGALEMWRAGHNVRDYYSQPGWYKVRKAIKTKIGVDIADDTITPFRAKAQVIILSEPEYPEWILNPNGQLKAVK